MVGSKVPKESIIVSYNFTFFLFLLTIKWNSEIVPPDGHSLGVTAPVVRDKKLTVNSKIYQINLRLTISSRVLSNLWKIKHWKLYGAVKLLFFPELGILMKLDLARGQALPPFIIWSSHPVAKIKALFCFQFPIVVIVWCLYFISTLFFFSPKLSFLQKKKKIPYSTCHSFTFSKYLICGLPNRPNA